jgi:nucleotide-binding universal stress UspA family protein
MALFEVLIPLSGADSDVPMLAAGQEIAGLFAPVRVTGAFAQPPATDSMIWAPDGSFGGYSASLVEALQKGAAEALELCKARCAKFPAMTLEDLVGQPDVVLSERGAQADVVVMDCAAARKAGPLAGVFEQLLLAAGLPLLVLRRPVATLKGRAVIAWDASAPAARALRAAMPLLAHMTEILVVQAENTIPDNRKAYAGMDRVVARLRASGVNAQTASFDGGRNVSEELVSLAAGFGADLLVAGAYGHSRFGEFVLGGTSRDLLADAATPSLFLHH